MDIKAEKLELLEKLLQTNDEETIVRVKAAFESSDRDFWDELPKSIQQQLTESIDQADQGELIRHEDVMKKYSQWFSK